MGDFARIYKNELDDAELMRFWAQALEAGRGRAIGYDMPPMDGPAFCRWLRQGGVHPWLVTHQGEAVGLYYLTGLQGRSAQVHFLTLPCGTRRTAARLPLPVAAGLFALGSSLWERRGSFVLDTLIGVTPAAFGPALRFVKRLGGEACGTVPGLCWLFDSDRNVPGIVTVFNRTAVPAWTAQL